MSHNLIDRLKQIQEDASKNHFNLDELKKLGEQAKKSFDDRIEQIVLENQLLQKIKVPKNYLKLWKHQGKDIKLPINWRYLLSAPFIYGMIVPAIIWHLTIEIYHQVCFRLYGIPRVQSKDFFLYDRQLLSILNLWEKVNCLYCSYVNNLLRYSIEIAGRTERYWCPIKYYRRISKAHSQYDKFVSSKDAKNFRQQWQELRDFSDLK